MGSYSSFKDYRDVWKRRSKTLVKELNKTCSEAADHAHWMARGLAPRDTGETMAGITKRKIANMHYQVQSMVRGTFKQNFFANITPPFARLKFGPRGGGAYGPNQVVTYGGAARSKEGVQIRWTGVPGFFSIAAIKTKLKLLESSQKAIRVTFKVS